MELAQTSASLSSVQVELECLRQEKAELETRVEEATSALEREQKRSTEMEGEAKVARRSEKATSLDLLAKLQAQAQQVCVCTLLVYRLVVWCRAPLDSSE